MTIMWTNINRNIEEEKKEEMKETMTKTKLKEIDSKSRREKKTYRRKGENKKNWPMQQKKCQKGNSIHIYYRSFNRYFMPIMPTSSSYYCRSHRAVLFPGI